MGYKSFVCKKCEAIELYDEDKGNPLECSLCIKKKDGLKSTYMCNFGHLTTFSIHDRPSYCSTCRSNILTWVVG